MSEHRLLDCGDRQFDLRSFFRLTSRYHVRVFYREHLRNLLFLGQSIIIALLRVTCFYFYYN